MPIKAIFWDNDGVLVDTERLYFAATRQVLGEVGIELSLPDFIQLFMVGNTGLDALAGKGLDAAAIDALRARRNALYSAMLAREELVIPGVRETLAALAPQCRMGIVTSSRKDHFEIIHRRSGLLRHIDFVLALGDYARSKPDPDPYLLAVERSGLPAEACLVVEDSERGLASALAAGLRCAIVPSDLTRGSRFDGAHVLLERVSDVISLVNRLNGAR
jgi:HAD superfamily hydrolase (TIGR01509 family)